MTHLRAKAVVPEGASLDLWRGRPNLREEWFPDNKAYWARKIDFEMRFRQHHEKWRPLFLGWYNVEVFTAAGSSQQSVSFGSRLVFSFCHDAFTLCVDSTGFSYCTGIHKTFRDDKRRVEIISLIENVSMTMDCFFAAGWNGNCLRLFWTYSVLPPSWCYSCSVTD